MDILTQIKWYNVIIIITLLIVTFAIILLPSPSLKNASGSCPLQCPKKEQFCDVPPTSTKQLTPIQNANILNTQIANAQPTLGPTLSNEPKHKIVLYYAMWCGYSRAFLPQWQEFVTWAKTNFNKITVDSVRCEDGNTSVCQEMGITGYPSVVLYLKDGTQHKFNGPRTSDGLKEFVNTLVH